MSFIISDGLPSGTESRHSALTAEKTRESFMNSGLILRAERTGVFPHESRAAHKANSARNAAGRNLISLFP